VCWATDAELNDRLGSPDYERKIDGNVTRVWYFDTPRGAVELQNSWCDTDGQHGIEAIDWRGGLHVARLLRHRGLKAYHRPAGALDLKR
jgi:hypothetical protein